jgi:hypothetical protein
MSYTNKSIVLWYEYLKRKVYLCQQFYYGSFWYKAEAIQAI